MLFRRAATPNEVRDALRSADTAQGEGDAAMERIMHDRMFAGLQPFGEPPDDFGTAPEATLPDFAFSEDELP